MGIAVDIRHPRQTMATCSRCLIRSFKPSERRPWLLPAEKRGVYLERMIAWLQFRGGRFIDRDLDDAVRLALRGLIHESAA
jgi:hypothetical protein